MDGTPADSNAFTAASDLPCRPDHCTLTGLSVLAVAAAAISAAVAALLPEIDAIRMTSWSIPGSSRTTSSVREKSVESLKTAAVISAGFSAEPKAGTSLRILASVSGANGGSVRPPLTAASSRHEATSASSGR